MLVEDDDRAIIAIADARLRKAPFLARLPRRKWQRIRLTVFIDPDCMTSLVHVPCIAQFSGAFERRAILFHASVVERSFVREVTRFVAVVRDEIVESEDVHKC